LHCPVESMSSNTLSSGFVEMLYLISHF
jgi:hypothetical protein